MGKKLPPDQLAFYKRVDEILWNDWDPIGVSDVSEARDEYYGYLPTIFAMALGGCNVDDIADRLHSYEQVNMGLPGNRDHCLWVAERICEARKELIKSTSNSSHV